MGFWSGSARIVYFRVEGMGPGEEAVVEAMTTSP